jgi:hypothetical protein
VDEVTAVGDPAEVAVSLSNGFPFWYKGRERPQTGDVSTTWSSSTMEQEA